ncbi:MAG TPA: EamA family transporter [Candidatus Acidoferrum sp.]|nr:EamA family transporter [Candidatus Acidoferrum sp.]
MDIYLIIFITLIAALIASFSQTLYKRGMTKRLDSIKEIVFMFKKKPILVGFFGYLVSLAVYLFALSKAPLSVVYPTFASTFIFITILSAVVLKEKINTIRIAGMAVIFIGIVVVALSL